MPADVHARIQRCLGLGNGLFLRLFHSLCHCLSRNFRLSLCLLCCLFLRLTLCCLSIYRLYCCLSLQLCLSFRSAPSPASELPFACKCNTVCSRYSHTCCQKTRGKFHCPSLHFLSNLQNVSVQILRIYYIYYTVILPHLPFSVKFIPYFFNILLNLCNDFIKFFLYRTQFPIKKQEGRVLQSTLSSCCRF